MKIKLTDFGKSDNLPVEFSFIHNMPNDYNLADQNVEILFKGNLKNAGLRYHISGKMESNLIFLCDSCLEPVKSDLEIDVDAIYAANSDDSEDKEIYLISNNCINLLDCLLENFYLNIPMKITCSDNCLGLCPACGKNLNFGNCGCDNTVIDPRFEVLRSLLKFKDKE